LSTAYPPADGLPLTKEARRPPGDVPSGIRCVHLVPETYPAGAENQALALLDELRRRAGFALELVCFEPGRSHEKFLALDIPVHTIGRRRRLSLDFPRRVHALREIYADRHPDILHTWLFEAHVVGLAAARRWPRTRVVAGQRSGAVQRTMRAHQAAMRLLLKRADYGIANSAVGRDILVELGMRPDRIAVTALGITDDRLTVTREREAVRSELGADSGPLVVCVGRASPDKDYPVLMTAMEAVWRRWPSATLAIVGPTAEQLASLGVTLSPRARATGWRDATADYLNAADVVAVSSFTEGYSNAAAEALLLGRPVVTTDAGDHPELVRASGGRVVPVRRPQLLGEAILDILEEPPEPDFVSAAARPLLTVSGMADATIKVYTEVLREPTKHR
jgi:glycosyltransferase involved in cell wall biosynthesis